MPEPTAQQLANVQALVWRLTALGDRAWAIRADILVACGTIRLGALPSATVERVSYRLKSRVEVLERAHELRKAGN